MTMGHFVTALVPQGRMKDAPIWLLLFCAQLPDFVWLALALVGLETPTPASFLDVSIIGLHAEMPYSHTGAGILVMALATAGVVYAVWRQRDLALWCGALVIVHELCDLLSGWQHEIFTRGTPRIGLGLYARSPVVALLIEAVFSALVVAWYVRNERLQGRAIAQKKQARLYAIFAGGSLFFIGNAYTSFRTLLHLR
jgi:hypothetical protein